MSALPATTCNDAGPWFVENDGASLQSNDFTHDVHLLISGDFAEGERLRYATNLAAKLNASAWQPIETAPKDGALVLLFAGRVGIGCWDAWQRDTEGRVIGMEHHRNQSALVDCWRWDGEGFECDPTHWQPLPAPPEAA